MLLNHPYTTPASLLYHYCPATALLLHRVLRRNRLGIRPFAAPDRSSYGRRSQLRERLLAHEWPLPCVAG